MVEADQSPDRPCRRRHRAGGVGLADGASCAGVIAVRPHQPTHIALARAGAGHTAAGIGAGDDAAVDIEADQAADIVAGTGDVATGRAVADSAAVVDAHKSADFACAIASADDRGAGQDIVQRALPQIADQGADVGLAGDAAAQQFHVGQGRTGAGVAEQADVGGAGTVDDQAADAVALPVEASCKLRARCTDGAKAPCAPHATVTTGLAGHGTGQAQVGAQAVTSVQVQRHQLQRVRGEDGRGVFIAQHRPGLARDHHPGIGEVEPGISGLITCVDGRHFGAIGTVLAGGAAVPVAVGDGCEPPSDRAADQPPNVSGAGNLAAGVSVGERTAHVRPAHQPARKSAGPGDRAGGIGIFHVGIPRAAHQSTGLGYAGHVGGRGRVADGAAVSHADQAAGLFYGAGNAAGDVGVAEGCARKSAKNTPDARTPDDSGVGQGQVADITRAITDQRNVGRPRTINVELVDAVAEPGKVSTDPAHRSKASATIPVGGVTCIDIGGQRMVRGSCVAHGIQIAKAANQNV